MLRMMEVLLKDESAFAYEDASIVHTVSQQKNQVLTHEVRG